MGPVESASESGRTGDLGLVRRLRDAGCVFAEDEAAELVAVAEGPEDLEDMVRRRVAGEPLEHVVGRVRFAGLVLRVGPGLFVPRQRTAFLAGEAARIASEHGARPVVVDLCCGVGAIAAVVEARVPDAQVYAGDLDPAAVECARRNLGPAVRVGVGDLYDALPAALAGRVDVLAVNAPYVPTGALGLLPREARDHEPASALDGGSDGLAVHRRVLASAPRWLAPGGTLLIEVGEDQVATVLDLVGGAAMVGTPVRGEEDQVVVRAVLASRATPSDRLGSIS